jgi:hypothetical protein
MVIHCCGSLSTIRLCDCFDATFRGYVLSMNQTLQMRRLLSVLLLSLICLNSCTKDKPANELIGTWELESTSNMSGPVNYPAGNANHFIFYSNHKFESKAPGNPLKTGLYKVSKKKDCSPRASDDMLILHSDGFNSTQYIEIANGKLSISTSNCIADGGTAIYHKL